VAYGLGMRHKMMKHKKKSYHHSKNPKKYGYNMNRYVSFDSIIELGVQLVFLGLYTIYI
jgi:hypothetical protein